MTSLILSLNSNYKVPEIREMQGSNRLVLKAIVLNLKIVSTPTGISRSKYFASHPPK
jgi:hypothetical protein